MVAAICGWHGHNERAARGLETRLDRGETMLIAAPALVETYAVLTRLPPPHRLAPEDALSLVTANFIAGAETIALEAAAYRHLLHDAPREGVAGGRIYDSRHRRMCDPGESHGAADVQRQGFRPVRAGRDGRGHAGIEPVQLLLRARKQNG